MKKEEESLAKTQRKRKKKYEWRSDLAGLPSTVRGSARIRDPRGLASRARPLPFSMLSHPAGLRARAAELRNKIARKSAETKATADPMLQDWFMAPGQKVVVEVEVQPGTLEHILSHAVDESLIDQYQGKDVYIWKFERGYGRNIAIPSWQLDKFNANVKGIRFYAERGLEIIGPKKIPTEIQ